MGEIDTSRERPIAFVGSMIRATLSRAKTKTRRVITPQPRVGPELEPLVDEAWQTGFVDVACPYGEPGDRLWVREAWRTPRSFDALNATQLAEQCAAAGYSRPWAPIEYAADGTRRDWNPRDPDRDDPPGRLRAARFMPRWASRILLEVLDVRVERVQAITAAGVVAEGVTVVVAEGTRAPLIPLDQVDRWERGPQTAEQAVRLQFASVWDEINGRRGYGWDVDPWVWVVTFRRLEPVADTPAGG